MAGILDKLRCSSLWLEWLKADDSPAAERTRHLLDFALANLPGQGRKKFARRIKTGSVDQIESAIHELVAHDLLFRLNLNPSYEPIFGNQTPDLSFEAEGTLFIAEVLTTHSPAATVVQYPDGGGESRDAGERARKISDSVREKCDKYAELKSPLIVFVFGGDHFILGPEHVEQALFGWTLGEIDAVSIPLEHDAAVKLEWAGILLPGDGGDPGSPNLSALVWCDWFNTLNRADPGPRLHCRVYHHWRPNVQLSEKAFEGFGQVLWSEEVAGIRKPVVSGDLLSVARFASSRELELRAYRADQPW